MGEIRAAAIQMDALVGDVEANLGHAEKLVEQAAEQGAQLVALPELFSTGYEYSDRVYACSMLRGAAHSMQEFPMATHTFPHWACAVRCACGEAPAQSTGCVAQ